MRGRVASGRSRRARPCARRLTVLGLGPGGAEWLTPAARALADATDILGYTTYVNMAGPFRDDQRVRTAPTIARRCSGPPCVQLAAEGRRVAIVSSGDPGVFAMAAAVLSARRSARSALGRGRPARGTRHLGVARDGRAGQCAARSRLLRDFAVGQPEAVGRDRDAPAARGRADLVMAFYNPISRARPWQLDRALDTVRAPQRRDGGRARPRHRPAGRDAHDDDARRVAQQQDRFMRTMVIVGSSTARRRHRQYARVGLYAALVSLNPVSATV